MTMFPSPRFSRPQDRREFLRHSALLALGAGLSASLGRLSAAGGNAPSVTLPFENGERSLVVYPQKRPLLQVTARPPQLETPFSVFNESLITPNDAFFVRYHLAGIPTEIDPVTYRLKVAGAVTNPLSLSLDEVKRLADSVEVVAVNQCSGNSRGFSTPRVAGGQLGHGAMGNARWKGVPLRKVLEKAGVAKNAVQVTFNGLDRPILEGTPDFVKALQIDHALGDDVLLAYAMNGEDLPMLNGYPLRLVVPGYYGTYWVKHLAEIEVRDTPFTGFWMEKSYRVPSTPDRAIPPGTTPEKTEPISRFTVRSFITNVASGAVLPVGREHILRGIAFDSGQGIRDVAVSVDGGVSWRDAVLGPDLGRFSFREWKIPFIPKGAGEAVLLARASNRSGEIQPLEPRWNPSGYLRNVVERVVITAASNRH